MLQPADLEFESKFWEKGILVAGVDEAGRGALAGPVFAAAVVYPLGFKPNFNVYDSKSISPKKREELYKIIIKNCLSFSIEMVDVDYIDKYNILLATYLAMNKALEKFNNSNIIALIDGNHYEGNFPHKLLIDGDSKSFTIASASILAKVERDRWMTSIAHKKYPEYGFDKHKGYGTKYHIEQILKHQPSDLHRKSFLKRILNGQEKLL
ncbi:MAG: ribonuclease HII [Ignavibacteria bacterium]|nr:ribonuclease HII [Ignavibacteria bacterium]